MLRINLLPSYIAERRLTRIAWVLTGTGVAAVIGGLLAYHFFVVVPASVAAKEKADQEEAAALQVTKIQNDTKEILAKIQPLKTKVDFVQNVQAFNLLVPEIYRNVAKYTYKRVEYNSMNVNGDTLAINGFVRELSDVGRFYLTLFANPDIKALSIRGMPGWPNAASQSVPLPGEGQLDPNRQGFPLSVSAQLVNAVAAPSYGGATAGGGGGGFGGMMGGMGGRGGGGPTMGAPMMPGGPGGMGGGGGGSLGGGSRGGASVD